MTDNEQKEGAEWEKDVCVCKQDGEELEKEVKQVSPQ